MSTDPAKGGCDSFGRTHDNENVFVVGASSELCACASETSTRLLGNFASPETIPGKIATHAEPARKFSCRETSHGGFGLQFVKSFRELADVRPGPGGPLASCRSSGTACMGEIMRRHGLTPAPPQG